MLLCAWRSFSQSTRTPFCDRAPPTVIQGSPAGLRRGMWIQRATATAAASSQATVAESLHLLSFAPDATEEEISQLVDGIWSLQYMAAGPICGSGGPLAQNTLLRPPTTSDTPQDSHDFETQEQGQGEEQEQGRGLERGVHKGQAFPFSHAVLFRYGNEASLRHFQSQPRVQLMLGGCGAPKGTAAITTLNFLGSVPNELEAIFRRGGEWEAGVELVLGLQVVQQAEGTTSAGGTDGTNSTGEAEEFLSLTQQLALSSAFAAVQCSYGRCLSVQHCGSISGTNGGSTGVNNSALEASAPLPSGEAAAQQQQQQQQGEQLGGRLPLPQPDMLMLVRFQGEEQLSAFLACPPVAALLEGDERLPLRALWSCSLETAPSESSSSRGVQGGLM